MSSILESMEKILSDVLTSFYQPFWFSVLLAALFMSVWSNARKIGWKAVFLDWYHNFRNEKTFRRSFFLMFYTALVLFKTLLNRNMWANPVSNVFGIWGLTNENGEFTAEAVENFMLLIPFILLLFWAKSGKVLGEKRGFFFIAGKSLAIALCFSLGIEFAQLLLRLGTFQLSDLCYNTLGGLAGGVIYWAGSRVIDGARERKRIPEEEENDGTD